MFPLMQQQQQQQYDYSGKKVCKNSMLIDYTYGKSGIIIREISNI